ncbi:MAG: response regulator, partial [Bacteroidales bacterium]|nr:response regulator [Bacteroidales bacterium]
MANFEYASTNTGMLLLEVRDTGIGIPDSQKEIIFEAFRQQSGQSNRKYEGTGLGLAITKKLVEKMDGHIEVHSEQGTGSVFQVTIDKVGFDNRKLPEKEINSLLAVNVRFKDSLVLIIDDVKANADAFIALADSPDIKFLRAESGEIALEILNHHKPDLIIMDIRMPGMDGFMATKAIRAMPHLANIPVIAYTASVFEMEKLNNHELFQGAIIKPVNKTQVIGELTRFLPYKTIKGQEYSIQEQEATV